MTRKTILALTVATAAAFGAASATSAQTVPVNNAGFEEPELSDGDFTQGSVPGWAVSGGGITGVFDPNDQFFPGTSAGSGDAVPPPGGGDQIAFIFIGDGAAPGAITQATGEIIAANTTYTLSAAAGQAVESLGRPFAGYEITLLAGNTVLATEADLVTPAPGTFQTVDVSFTTGAADPNIGQPLSIRLATTTNSAAAIDESFFDSVQVTAVPVPEPAGLGLLALGGLGLLLRRRPLRA